MHEWRYILPIMKKITALAFLLPLIGLVYMYANQGIGVLIGSPEHHEILSAIGLSADATAMLVWTSVVVDLAVALLLIFSPSWAVFLFAGLWTWIPRAITFVYGGPENEVLESLAVSVLALLAYLAYRKGHRIRLLRRGVAAA